MLPSSVQRASLEERARRFEAAGPSNLLGYLTGRGLGVAALERCRPGYVEPPDDVPRRYWHRLAIPYNTPAGVVQIRYRCLIDHHPPQAQLLIADRPILLIVIQLHQTDHVALDRQRLHDLHVQPPADQAGTVRRADVGIAQARHNRLIAFQRAPHT